MIDFSLWAENIRAKKIRELVWEVYANNTRGVHSFQDFPSCCIKNALNVIPIANVCRIPVSKKPANSASYKVMPKKIPATDVE